jgi:hypothetical protein
MASDETAVRDDVPVTRRRFCVDCHAAFSLSAAEAGYFIARALQLPKRCRPCRELRRLRREEGV